MTLSSKKTLILFSILFGISAAAGTLLANLYWLTFGTTVDLATYLPETIWDGVFSALSSGLIMEALFVAIFIYPVLKMKQGAKLAFLIINLLAASFATYVFVEGVAPINYAGWGYMSLILLIIAPFVLSITLLIMKVRSKEHDSESLS